MHFSVFLRQISRIVATSVWRLPSSSIPGCCGGRRDVNCTLIFQMFHQHYSDNGWSDEIWPCNEFNDSSKVVHGKLISAQLAARFLYIMGLSCVTFIRYTLMHSYTHSAHSYTHSAHTHILIHSFGTHSYTHSVHTHILIRYTLLHSFGTHWYTHSVHTHTLIRYTLIHPFGTHSYTHSVHTHTLSL